MKKVCLAILAMVANCLVLNAASGKIDVTPEVPTAATPLVLKYTPSANEQWMLSQDVYIYVCVEMDQNGEWVKEKAEWSKCNVPNYKWTKNADGTFTYTLNADALKEQISLSQTFVLDIRAEHDAFRTALKGNIVARVTDGTVNAN